VKAGASVIVPFSAIETPRASPLITSSCFEISQNTGPTAIAEPDNRANIIDTKAVLIRAADLYIAKYPFNKKRFCYIDSEAQAGWISPVTGSAENKKPATSAGLFQNR
jgi:hypothetical protein